VTPVLVFDIETIPDLAGLRRVNGVPGAVDDTGLLQWATQQRRAQSGNDFLPLQFQQIVAISCALREGTTFRVWSLGESSDREADLIRRFFDGIERYTPQLVSWNGSVFDLPVLHYRALVHGLSAARYWDWGDDDKEFRYNNYLNRYHTRHLDLMDVLAGFQPRGSASLDSMARLCGFPGKLGMDGSAVYAAFAAGEIDSVRRYCETDVMNTYLLYLRFQLLRGALSPADYASEVSLAREKIAATGAVHWIEFLNAWDA
jgi:predicted PolB exonuclease-like 3'-5' exonuclease